MAEQRVEGQGHASAGTRTGDEPGAAPPLRALTHPRAGIPCIPRSSSGDPTEEHVLRERVEASLLAGHFELALGAIGRQLALHTLTDTALHLLGVVRLSQGDLDSAGDCLLRALELRSGSRDPERSSSTLSALARVSMERSDFPRAWGDLDRALALDPLSLHVLWNRLCLARAELSARPGRNPSARQRLVVARRALQQVDPAWREERDSAPYLLSLK